jgi:hypothetical protein
MARYRTTLDATASPEAAFDYLAEFSNAKHWDPGVVDGENLDPGPVGPGSRFRLVARFLGRDVPLEYRVAELDRPRRVVLEAEDGAVRSVDEIRVAKVDGTTRVTYEADLRLRGPFGRVLDPLLALVFRRIGDRAAGGLRQALGR